MPYPLLCCLLLPPPLALQVGHMRQLEHMDMEAEVQGLAAEQHGRRFACVAGKCALDGTGGVRAMMIGPLGAELRGLACDSPRKD